LAQPLHIVAMQRWRKFLYLQSKQTPTFFKTIAIAMPYRGYRMRSIKLMVPIITQNRIGIR
jgi:hypothetical protein